MLRYMAGITALCVLLLGADAFGESNAGRPVKETVYRGDLLSFPGPWRFTLGKPGIILVADDELETLADPDKPVNLSMSAAPDMHTLRQICESAQANKHQTLMIAFDHFFSQYRVGQEGKPRRLTPDMDEYIALVAKIGAFAQEYGLGLELSLLSPLEVGKVYEKRTGESGMWMHYREGARDPKTGRFSVELWQHRSWSNNKGPIDIADAGVRVFAFKEAGVPNSPYHVVNPADIVEVSSGAQVEVFENIEAHIGDFRARRVRVHGESAIGVGLDRVLVVQQYKTPEMDYFSPKALPFLTGLIDQYAAAGVKLNGLYSDEMHIQQDWGYFAHHDHGEFALRYVSPGLAETYAKRFGEEYKDFAKYLVYFVRGQHDFVPDLSAKQGAMHVFGSSPEDVRRTALFRARYYKLLQDGVVDLFVAAKRYTERKMGHTLEARAHATWAESPTIDLWETGPENISRNQYEYTSNFVWSNTVQQASSACYDYFKWGDYLTGNGNDHAECGWLDRNYVGLALACSLGILNDTPYAYGAHWGMPAEISARRNALVDTYGASASPPFMAVQEATHRDTAVLMLYPMDLVAVDERFGSWMTQYGYANYISADKLLERGKLVPGAIDVAGRRFTTLVALFEPFPSEKLLDLMQGFVEQGGRVIWSGPPPVLSREGGAALDKWQALFGVRYTPGPGEGLLAPGRQVVFEGPLAGIAPQTILTDLLPDRIYPVEIERDTVCVARVKGAPVASLRALPTGGNAVYLGYRPRDDQSKSLGYESRNWFDVLATLQAYPGTGVFPDVNDNTDYLSRTTPYLYCRFPNGAVAVAPHLTTVEESWEGGFIRDAEKDKAALARLELPSDTISLKDVRVNGHTVSFDGARSMCFRADDHGTLIAFAGYNCTGIVIDGRTTTFADAPVPLACWTPVTKERRIKDGAIYQFMFGAPGSFRVPGTTLTKHPLSIFAEGPTPGSRGKVVESRVDAGNLVLVVPPDCVGRWLYAVPGEKSL